MKCFSKYFIAWNSHFLANHHHQSQQQQQIKLTTFFKNKQTNYLSLMQSQLQPNTSSNLDGSCNQQEQKTIRFLKKLSKQLATLEILFVKKSFLQEPPSFNALKQ